MSEYLIGMGAAKCGTTLLHALIRDHPDLKAAKKKELNYFDRETRPSKREYDEFFGDTDKIKLDITPIYMASPRIVEDIVSTLGADNIKMVVLLRDPIERAYSHYCMNQTQDMEKMTFAESFACEKERIARNAHDFKSYSYFLRGLYAQQLDCIYRHVKRENVRVYVFEDFVKNQQARIDDLCDFAGISRIIVQDKHINRGVGEVKVEWLSRLIRTLSKKTPESLKLSVLKDLKHKLNNLNAKSNGREPLPREFHDTLVRYYEEDVRRLRSQYGIDTSLWKNF